jgi:hypothetical protein
MFDIPFVSCYYLYIRNKQNNTTNGGKKMSLAIIILGVMYLMGYDIGTALAISSIVTGVLISVTDILKAINKEQEKGWR